MSGYANVLYDVLRGVMCSPNDPYRCHHIATVLEKGPQSMVFTVAEVTLVQVPVAAVQSTDAVHASFLPLTSVLITIGSGCHT